LPRDDGPLAVACLNEPSENRTNPRAPQKSWRIRDRGLRAATVIPAGRPHAGFETLSGGSVGVDIFFVFSGYLITTSIISELERGDFSIIR
jgi:peptidoglycan/LPS O-acetylase OafA/YrhL